MRLKIIDTPLVVIMYLLDPKIAAVDGSVSSESGSAARSYAAVLANAGSSSLRSELWVDQLVQALG